MAKKNDFTKRANELLTARLDPVKRLGELLDAKAEKEAELKSLDSDIEKAAQSCIEAGWKPAELTDLGVPRAALPRRQTRTAALEPRTDSKDQPSGEGAAGGPAPNPTP
ncbi:hypothetical protein A5739_07125 [Mycobacterium colombiense]|uniref:hypothetical protein n=1 Tax=Mycobacterium colombiense TaxID=339268 RepID=UPI00096C1F8A|nr:hypothetical protein [Mycobacterium colombiense]OMC33647.1 hypothetical protein A5739_07125 [Mycobacterium colombiense]